MPRPSKKYAHKDKRVDAEFSNVYTSLVRADFGPFRFVYDLSTEKLYMQVKISGNKYYTSVMSIDKSGNMVTTGTQTPSTSITDVGRS